MSFATKGMTRGERSVPVPRSVPAPLAAQPAPPRSFSNAGVIDYRQGLNFANMLAGTQHDTFAASKQYNVNLDAEGHTVSMHMEPKTVSMPFLHAKQQMFLSTDQIADVALRIAFEMSGKSAPEPAASVPVDALSPHLAQQLGAMQQRIDLLQTALKFGEPLPPEPALATSASAAPVTTASAALATSATAELEEGLRHHAVVLRASQDKLDALESDMSHLMATAAVHAYTLAEMDNRLRNQKSEIESTHDSLHEHTGRMDTSDAQLTQLASDLEQRQAERKSFEARCRASVTSLRTDLDNSASATANLEGKYVNMSAGLQNHQNEIRAIRSAHDNTYKTQAGNEMRLSEMKAGLENHRQEIRDIRNVHEQSYNTQSSNQLRLSEMTAGLDNHRQEIRALKSERESSAHNPVVLAKLQRLDAGLEDHASELRSLRTQIASSAGIGTESMRTHMQSLDTSLEQHKTEIRSLRTAMRDVPSETNVAAVSAGLHNHRSEIRAIRSTLSDTEKQLGSLQTAGQPVTAQLLGMQTRLDTMQNALVSQTTQARAMPNVLRSDLSWFVDRLPVR